MSEVNKPPSRIHYWLDERGVRISKVRSQNTYLDRYEMSELDEIWDLQSGRWKQKKLKKKPYGVDSGKDNRYPELTLVHLDENGEPKENGQGTQIHRFKLETWVDFPWPPLRIEGVTSEEYQMMYNEITQRCSEKTIKTFNKSYDHFCNQSYQVEHKGQDVKKYALEDLMWDLRRSNVGSSIRHRKHPITGKVQKKERVPKNQPNCDPYYT